MFKHEKKLLYEVKVEKPNPQYAVLMQEQLGGGNGELKAAMQYISQSFTLIFHLLEDILIILIQRLQALITQEDRFNFKVKRAVQILCTATSILKLNFIFFVHAYKVIW